MRFVLTLRNFATFTEFQDLATIDALRDMKYPSCAYLVRLLRICVRAYAYLNYVAREYFIFGVGFALSVLNSKAMRQPHNVELAKGKFRAFFVPLLNGLD